jgi:lambda repressor-like predicted transcriptional regulator
MVGNDEEHTSGRTADEPPAGASESPGASKWQLVIAAARRLRERGLEVTAEAAAQEAGVPVEEISRNWSVLARQLGAPGTGDDPPTTPPAASRRGRGRPGRGSDAGEAGEPRRAARPRAQRADSGATSRPSPALEKMLATAHKITAGTGWKPVSMAEFARRAKVHINTVDKWKPRLESEFPGLFATVWERMVAVAREITAETGWKPVSMAEFARRAGVHVETVRKWAPRLESEFPGLFATVWERMVAIALEITAASGWAPITVAEFARRAGVCLSAVRNHRPRLESEFPGLFGTAWQQMLATAREITAQPGWRPVTKAEFARRAGVSATAVRYHQVRLESEFPGLFATVWERMLATAREITAQPGRRPVTVAEFARRAGVHRATVRLHRGRLQSKFPGLLERPETTWERMRTTALEITAKPGWRPVTVREFAKRAGVHPQTVGHHKENLDSEFPTLLKVAPRGRPKRSAAESAAGRVSELIRSDIAHCRYEPRQRLVVSELVRAYGASVHTVGSALRMLYAGPGHWVKREVTGKQTRWYVAAEPPLA